MKISVIMQVYLGDYPGARANPHYKFVRAVNSFLMQTHRDKELIIVSDGCNDTRDLYERLFSSNPQIKFAYVSRGNVPRMREMSGGVRHYRGLPRQVGRSLADGDLVTYLDGDDIMLPPRLEQLNAAWKEADPNMVWSYNTMCVQPIHHAFRPASDKEIDLKLFGFPIAEKVYPGYMVPPGQMLASPPAICHRLNVKSVWKDTQQICAPNGTIISGDSEDYVFVDGLRKESRGFKFDAPSYVVCHLKDGWDI